MSRRTALTIGSTLAFLFASLAACSDDGDEGKSTTPGADAAAPTNAANPSAPPPAGSSCAPALGAAPSACPDETVAEGAWAKVRSTCAIDDGDLDASNPNDPNLLPGSKAKLCASCACRTAVFEYRTVYLGCTDEDQANAAFSKNLHTAASGCN